MGLIHFIVPDLLSGRADGDEVEAEMWGELQCKGDRQGRVLMPEREREGSTLGQVLTHLWIVAAGILKN